MRQMQLYCFRMEAKGCIHDEFTFTILIFGHVVKGRTSEAIEINIHTGNSFFQLFFCCLIPGWYFLTFIICAAFSPWWMVFALLFLIFHDLYENLCMCQQNSDRNVPYTLPSPSLLLEVKSLRYTIILLAPADSHCSTPYMNLSCY